MSRRRRRPLIGYADASALRAEIQIGSSIQRSCDTTYFVFTDAPFLAAAKLQQRRAACCGSVPSACFNVFGSPIFPPTVCFLTPRTHPAEKGRQPAGSLRDRRLAAPRHEPLTAAARLPPWRCQRRQPRRSGSLMLLVAPSSGRHAPCRGSYRLARPCGAPAGYGCANARQGHRIGSRVVAGSIEALRHAPSRGVVALLAHEARLPLWLRQQRQPRSVGSPFVRCRFPWAASSLGVHRRACRPAIACGKRLPSRSSATASAMVDVFGKGCAA